MIELAATARGRWYGVADIVTGGLVLAVVTGVPNAVSAVYLARRGRGAAMLSIALNSNAINVTAGLLGWRGRPDSRRPDHHPTRSLPAISRWL